MIGIVENMLIIEETLYEPSYKAVLVNVNNEKFLIKTNEDFKKRERVFLTKNIIGDIEYISIDKVNTDIKIR